MEELFVKRCHSFNSGSIKYAKVDVQRNGNVIEMEDSKVVLIMWISVVNYEQDFYHVIAPPRALFI